MHVEQSVMQGLERGLVDQDSDDEETDGNVGDAVSDQAQYD